MSYLRLGDTIGCFRDSTERQKEKVRAWFQPYLDRVIPVGAGVDPYGFQELIVKISGIFPARS